ncbi:MAG TPA: DUF2255 family protein [Solirubrobacterales bacterium]|jgi:hypothetical protein|nr:DUF2255 family protein [Solirubrobacterales bacterium]
MPVWNATELERIASTREIEISSLREDGALTRPVTIWAVEVDGELYVRSVRGDAGGWYRAAGRRHEGRIEAGDTAVDVAFEDAPHHLDEEIDAAYKEKYGYPSDPVDSITTDAAKATTIRVVPR